MTKFSDQLFDDLMREHGPALAHAGPPAQPKRHITARQTLLASGSTLAVGAAVAGVLVAQNGTPAHIAGSGAQMAYEVTNNSDGTITLAVYQKSGIAGANTRLHRLGDKQVVVVPIERGCTSKVTPPAVSGKRPPDHHGDIPFARRDHHRERARHPGRGHPRDRRGDQREHLVRRRNPGLAPGAELRGPAPAASRQRRLRIHRRLRVISGAGGESGAGQSSVSGRADYGCHGRPA